MPKTLHLALYLQTLNPGGSAGRVGGAGQPAHASRTGPAASRPRGQLCAGASLFAQSPPGDACVARQAVCNGRKVGGCVQVSPTASSESADSRVLEVLCTASGAARFWQGAKLEVGHDACTAVNISQAGGLRSEIWSQCRCSPLAMSLLCLNASCSCVLVSLA